MGEILYYSMFVTGFVISVFINGNTANKFGYSKQTAVLYSSFTFISGIIGAMLMAKIKDGILGFLSEDYLKQSTVCIFGSLIFAPFLMLIVFKMTGADKLKGLDFIAPEVYMILAFSKLGCTCAGCCYGIDCEWGIYNKLAGHNVFPVQICEALATFVIFSVLLFIIKKERNKHNGCVFSLGLILYTFCRFFFEMLRYYENTDIEGNIICGFSLWQLLSVFTFIAGLIMFIHCKKIK